MKGKIEYSLIRTFIPSKDHELSRDFYKDLGFEISWEDKDLVIFGQGRQTFFLQRYYNKVWAENFMMQAFVNDLEALFNHVKELKKKYKMRVRSLCSEVQVYNFRCSIVYTFCRSISS